MASAATPTRRADTGPPKAFLAGLSSALVAYSSVLNARPPPTPPYVAANLAGTGVLLALGRARGLTWAQLGLDAAAVVPGLGQGAAVAAAAGTGLATAVSLPASRRLLLDRRVADIDAGELLRRMFVRIPLGTVVPEEVAFRGLLLAAWTTGSSRRAAVAGSSAVFGLWHVAPTLQLLRVNAPGARTVQRLAAVAAGTAVTALGGVGLCVLRQRSGGLVAPALAHAAVNALSAAAAFVAHRLAGAGARAGGAAQSREMGGPTSTADGRRRARPMRSTAKDRSPPRRWQWPRSRSSANDQASTTRSVAAPPRDEAKYRRRS